MERWSNDIFPKEHKLILFDFSKLSVQECLESFALRKYLVYSQMFELMNLLLELTQLSLFQMLCPHEIQCSLTYITPLEESRVWD